MIGKRLIIIGRVQGVSFRYYTQLKAKELGLWGYVCNQKDGTVLIEVIGELVQINYFVQWCHSGSPASKVDEVIQEDMDLENKNKPVYNDFVIRR